ncbi:bifunctional 3-deoxy-7-phosphoheptulonate synthase/chorismate mutase [Novibacillus thermophilus]|uniref:Chorismate mutase n=1 Tax=Novibacillus thermophilus TaxID=1471761 RepID=A0A1U9K7M9_9BACL|nr:bifunctional 3-deoxy-7-phosphoheptulonate synthase/chorismate mutase [Novibacillus thermophilus]AQS56067.1 chorismate mutase [Novibacillus thermophilus]
MAHDRLEELRKELDKLNLDILDAITKRATIVQEIGKVKAKQGIDKFDPIREKKMLDELVAKNNGPFDDNTVRYLFKQIFKASLELQQNDQKKVLLVSRKEHTEDTVVKVGGEEVGNGHNMMIAGPCSVESEEQVREVAKSLKRMGVPFLRGGAFKPRTSPYDFQGLGEKGLKILRKVADEFGLKIVSEIVSPEHVSFATDYVDVIQIGARNMQNFELLKRVGTVSTPVLLKRGMSATIEEFMFAAEYIVSQGNRQVMLCERGIRTYEKATRNTLDISAVPILKQETHLPVIVDITHSTGRRDILLPIAKSALAAGADGIMVEVHPEPAVALSDAKQQINIPQFEQLTQALYDSGLLHMPTKVS